MRYVEDNMNKQPGPIAICVINLKGGVGKSTIAALLARQAFRRNLDVLAIDLDPQANLSQGLMHGDYRTFLSEQRPSIVEIFNGFIAPSSSAPSPTPLQANTPFEVIAQSDTRSLQLIPSRFDFSDNLLVAIRPEPKTLAKFLASNFKHKDLIIIDCSPTESILTTAAYHASGYVLVPVKPEYFATIGFPLLRQSLDNFKSRNRGNHISVVGVVINNAFYDGGNNGGPEKARALQEIREESNKNGWKVYTREIEHSRGYPKIMRGDYSYSGNAQYFSMFGNEFFESIGL
jgi:chromosome partitioning protein